MSDSTAVMLYQGHQHMPARRRGDDVAGPPPKIITAAGGGAEFAWEGFLKG
jgi:hypothetical protein